LNKANKSCVSLSESELFVDLPTPVFKELVANARTKDFATGEVIFFVGDSMKQVLLLTEGLVKKSQLSENGKETVLRLAVPGEVVSELALVPGGTHSSTAQALQDCKVLAWDSAAFEAASVCFPGLRSNALRILERRLTEIESRFSMVSTKTATPRLASGLLHLMDHLGEKVNSHIEVNITQETLAQMTAMTSFQVCRLLSLWNLQGLVKPRKGTIEIHSVPRLLELCRVK
jgi:CRP-like cAMP-binding protein